MSLSDRQQLIAAFQRSLALNQEALTALDAGHWERLEAIFLEKAGLDTLWQNVPQEGWSREELDAVFSAQAESARSEARLAQALAGLGPKLRSLGQAYARQEQKPPPKGLDIGT